MLALFSNTYQSRGQISQHPQLEWLKVRIKENVSRQQEYYASAARAVFADHPLAQLLKLIGANARLDDFDVYDNSWVRAPYVSRNLGFTSEVNKGTFKKHRLYDSDSSMILAVPEYISVFSGLENWRDLEPVRTLWIDRPYLDMAVPSSTGDITDFSAAVVDIPRLVLMYRGFLNYRKKIMAENINAMVLGEESFVAMYALPAMLKSQADISAVSATQAYYYDRYAPTIRVQTPIYLPSYSDTFQKVAKYALERIDGAKMQYSHMLQHLPSIYKSSALSSLVMPDMVPTTQVQWSVLVARLKTIMFLLDIGGKNGINTNRGYINEIQKKTRQISLSGIPYNVMGDELANFVDNSILRIQRI